MSYRNDEPTGLDLLKEEYGTRWDITVDDTGMIRAVRKFGDLPDERWEWTVEELHTKLAAYEAEQAASRVRGAS